MKGISRHPWKGLYPCPLPVAVEDILVVKDDYQVKWSSGGFEFGLL
jgi:hypothetical protein